MHSLLAFIGAHPHAALLMVGLVAFAESLAIVGTIVPAALVMFTAGALVGTGALQLWWTLAVAATGAVLGDGLSYELGRANEARIRAWRLFQHRSDVIARAEALVRRHGGKSVVLARFTGPVRAFVPLLAGFARMPRLRFYTVNVFSALLWAPAHILPGVLFGSSLQIAEAVSSRLAIIAILLLAVAWGTVWLVSAAFRLLPACSRRLRDAVQPWAQRNKSPLAQTVLALLDPAHAASRALLLAAAIVVVAGWLFLGVLEDVLMQDPLVQADLAVFNFLQALRTPYGDQLMVAITEMGSVGTLLPLVAVVAGWLAWRRCWHTTGYWLAAAGGGELLVRLLKSTLGRHRPVDLYTGVEQFSFPSGHATMSVVLLGFLAFLLARRQPFRTRLAIMLAASLYVLLVSFSRLYLGAHWLSDVLGGWSLGIVWVALIAMVYTLHRVDEPTASKGLLWATASSLLLFGALWIEWRAPSDLARYTTPPATHAMAASEWQGAGWKRLPFRRQEIAGELEESFNLQWACSKASILQTMNAAGWQAPRAWSITATIAWLAPHASLPSLPVLPRLDRGQSPGLILVHAVADHPEEREVLRLWSSHFELPSVEKQPVPLWYGAIYHESVRSPAYSPLPFVSHSPLSSTQLISRLAGTRLHTTIRADDEKKVLLIGGDCPAAAQAQ